MENGWNLFNFNTTTTTSFGRVHNASNCTTTTTAWDISESGTSSTSRIDWSGINPHNSFTSSASSTVVSSSATATHERSAALVPALMVAHEGNHHHVHYSNSSDPSRLYGAGGGGGSQYFPDPHLMCLKLGKRHYFGDAIATPLGDHQAPAAPCSITKKGKPYYDAGGDSTGLLEPSTAAGVTVAASTVVPKCQVDGCNVVLLNAKDYHRRHKVCEIHSKAPKVVVLGLEQRFCQQCSRFHAVSEFDESKRSCRRRLAGHNERRRKSSQEHSGLRNQSQVNTRLMSYPGRHAYLPLNSACALSLLSSKNDSWISAADFPARCSAALRELIAENRAAILARQLILDKDWHWHHHPVEDLNGRQSGSLNYQQQMATGSHNWGRMDEADAHVTLDLMQAPNSAFGFLSMRGKSKEDDEECPELWSSFGGAHVV